MEVAVSKQALSSEEVGQERNVVTWLVGNSLHSTHVVVSEWIVKKTSPLRIQELRSHWLHSKLTLSSLHEHFLAMRKRYWLISQLAVRL